MSRLTEMNGFLCSQKSNEKEIIIIKRTIAKIFALVEIAAQEPNYTYMSAGKKLNKHREARNFDLHLQKLFLYLRFIGDFEAKVIECDKNGLHRTELFNANTNQCIHIVNSFDPKAKYIKKYLDKNCDEFNPKYALIKFELSKEKTYFKDVSFAVPNADGQISQKESLINLLSSFRCTLLDEENVNINNEVEKLRNTLLEFHQALHSKAEILIV